MGKIITSSILVALVMGCSPDVDDDDGDSPGMLEYEIPVARFYRLDRRVDIVGVDPMVDRSGCGFLTDHAHEDLVNAFEELDPKARYDHPDCEYAPEGTVYLEDFTHGPFPCSWYCCHPDLITIAVVYWAAGSSLYDQTVNIDGEPYVALEPDVPCSD